MNRDAESDDGGGNDDTSTTTTTKPSSDKKSPSKPGIWNTIKWLSAYFAIYFAGIVAFLLIIAEPFTLKTYFSDNSLLPGFVNREFSLMTEAEYYLKVLDKLVLATQNNKANQAQGSFATLPSVTNFIKNELDNFGLEVHEQNFSYLDDDERQYNGTNIFSIIRGERSTSSESIALCAPFKKNANSDTLSSVALTMALAKYFSSKSYWAKDVIILLVDRDSRGLSAWLDSYHDVQFRQDIRKLDHSKDTFHYDSLTERSGPMQAALVLELNGRKFSRVNIKIQGMFGQLPNLDLFNLVFELATRESVTSYLYNKSIPYDVTDSGLYMHHLETALSFIKTQASMKSDGLHGHFLRYAIQSLTIEGPEYNKADRNVFLVSLLNIGRMVEGVFRSLNNLPERFNRSYYFYIPITMRRFTSIGYYMIAFGLMVAPLAIRAYRIHEQTSHLHQLVSLRVVILLCVALLLSLVSTFNISTALVLAVSIVPILLLI